MKSTFDRGSEFWNIVLALLLLVLFTLLIAVVVIEWAAGCGESYVDAAGQRHMYECVYLNNHKE